MDIKQLKYFKTIVDEGNISKAAEVLHMAQPPLSQQLKRLEMELGTVLIKRYTHQWEITETGKILYRHAMQMLQENKGIKQDIREMEQGIRGTLSIGVSSSCVTFLPENIRRFRENYPHVFIKVWKGDSFYLQKLLEEREIELSFMLLPMTLQGLQVKRLPQNPFVVVIPSKWKSEFPKETVNLKEIKKYPFLMLGPIEGHTTYETILNMFHKHQFKPNIVMECIDIQTLLSFVASEIGISIIPRSEINGAFRQDIITLEMEDVSLYIDPAIIWLKQNRLTKAAEHFLDYYTS